MDPLENRIKTLEEAMQSVEQPDKLAIWKGISRHEAAPKRSLFRISARWAAAAAVFLLGVCTYYRWQNTRQQCMEAAAIAQLPMEWQLKAKEYQLLVKQYEQKVPLNSQNTEAIADEIQVLQEVNDLQASFLADFETLPKDHRTGARYVRYYEQRIRILELIVKKFEIHKHEEERNTWHQG